MQRRQFLLHAGLVCVAAPFTSLCTPATAASTRASRHDLLLRRVENANGSTYWQAAHASVETRVAGMATATRQWRVHVEGFVAASTTVLSQAEIEAHYSNGKGGTNVHKVYRYDDANHEACSAPVLLHTGTQGLRAFVLHGQGRGRSTDHQCPLALDADAELTPGRYAWLLSDAPLAARDWVDSGDPLHPLTRRDGQSLTADYLSFTITSLT